MTELSLSVEEVKQHAKNLRARLAAQGSGISHAQALERVAQELGFRDWNTLRAAISHRPMRAWRVGDRVRGRYLSQPFVAEVVSVQPRGPGWVQLELKLDAPIDVVTSERFSNKRQRLRATIGPKGHSSERTGDGTPHLQLDLA